MREMLHDRFRPFKPYDLVLAVLMFLLVAPGRDLDGLTRATLIACGVLVFWGLDWAQRLVRVPSPLWQSLTIVSINTLVVATLVHLNGMEHGLAFSMLSVCFATVAFGQHVGIAAAVLSTAMLSQVDYAARAISPFSDWMVERMLFLAVLLTLVAILVRINRLQQDALLDAVTNLRNHRYFQVRLREELHRSDRFSRPTALILLDLDNFKLVNDRFGHAFGDMVLRQVSQTLMQNARAVDIVCRYGGEELAVVLPETTLEEAMTVAERLRVAVAKRPDERGGTVTLSAGVAIYPEHAIDADGLIAAADAAMYRAKRAGKNQVAQAEPVSAAYQS